MNPDRLVIRMAAIAALTNFNSAPWPTVAGPHIFDSKIDPLEDFAADVVFPVCVIYTDYDREHWEHHTLNVSKERTLTVTFELLLAQITESTDPNVYQISHPITDSELETSLDLFEMQVVNAFSAENVAADCWRALMATYVNVISRRGATVEGGQKLAARQVTVEAQLARGPANGTIRPQVAALLNALEQYDDYKDRIPKIREMYTSRSSMTAAEQLLAAMGWSDQIGGVLGFRRGPESFLPAQPIVYTLPNGNPLP